NRLPHLSRGDFVSGRGVDGDLWSRGLAQVRAGGRVPTPLRGVTMSDSGTFAEVVGRIRAGDEQAATDLVGRYEPVIRVAVRARLGDRRLRRVLDSMDLCQSVLKSFFARAAAGQYDLERPDQLARLLVSIARNKVAFQARRQRAGNRDLRRDVPLAAGDWDVAGAGPSPSRVASGRELLAQVRRRLPAARRRP